MSRSGTGLFAAETIPYRRLVIGALTVRFGGVLALDGVDMVVERGEILGLIGPNGAGKTTVLNVVTGFQRPNVGSVHLDEVEITSWHPSKIARNGVVRSFQSVRLFGGLSVLENAELGAVGRGFRLGRARSLARAALDIVDLSTKAYWKARLLAHGEQRRLGLARAICTQPLFLLLDEPAAGLSDAERTELVAAVRQIRDSAGCGVVVIEHDIRFISALCNRVQVLDYGKTISIGTPAKVQADAAVVSAYLGTAKHA